jgi:carbon-monoxide dehydrogenase medium subunit
MWKAYVNATSVEQVLQLLSEYGHRARIIAGGTDLLLEIERGQRKNIEVLIDVTRISDLSTIYLDDENRIHLGPLVTHNHCVASELIQEKAFSLAQAAWLVGAPQIRNRGTVAGNLITASPANDTITPLVSFGAEITLQSLHRKRIVSIDDFYLGVRQTVMEPDEFLVDISLPAMKANQKSVFLKLGLRQAQAISVVNVAVLLTFERNIVQSAAIALGSVAPKIIRAERAESFLSGKQLTKGTIEQAASFAMESARPIDDLRGSKAYRREMVRVLTSRCLRFINEGSERKQFPIDPVLLWGNRKHAVVSNMSAVKNAEGNRLSTTVNGKKYVFSTSQRKTLLDLLRDDFQLIGTKEGCAEGECGACTVWLDGMAVMACLVPAPRAHGAEITTIEGIKNMNQLHPVQEAFIHEGAVQCGYCTPGFLMSAAKLLEEIPKPTKSQIKDSITGNLCRCTGYYKIVDAIDRASQEAYHDEV